MCQVIGPLKKPLSICQSAWREIWNALPEIHRVCWGPRKCIWALFYKCYYPRLNYVCDTGYPTPNKQNLTVESSLTFSNCTGCRGFVHLRLPPFLPLLSGNQSRDTNSSTSKRMNNSFGNCFGNGEQQFCGEGPRILLWEDKGALQFLKITIKTQNSREDLWKKIEGLVGNACMKFMLITVITESKDTLHQEWAEIQRKEKEVLIKLC